MRDMGVGGMQVRGCDEIVVAEGVWQSERGSTSEGAW